MKLFRVDSMLDEIKILSDTFCKKFTLSHDYFDSGNLPSTLNKRLRLTDVHEQICNGTATQGETINPYILQYNGTYLPSLESKDRDHWDYYNNAGNTGFNIPESSFTFPILGNTVTIGGSNRESDEEAMKAGILTKFILPTKGELLYKYEANRYFDPISNSTKLCGGLRIKEIIEYDGIDSVNNIVKKYEYINSNGNSSGILFKSNGYPTNNPIYARSFGLLMGNNPCSIGCPYQGTQPGSCGSATVFLCMDESYRPMTNSNGNHIFYTNVQEYYKDFTRIKYIFEIPDIPPLGPIITFPQPPNQISLKSGLLLSEEKISIYNVPDQTVENNNYTIYTRSPEYFLKVTPYELASGQMGQCHTIDFEHTKYPIFSGRVHLLSKTTTLDEVTSIESFEYDPDARVLSPISKTIQNSEGKTFRTEYNYNFDYFDTSIRSYLLANNIIIPPFKTISKVNGIQVDGAEIEYSFYDSNGIPTSNPSNNIARNYKYYRYKKTWDTQGNLIGPGKSLISTNTKYDANGNLSEIEYFGWNTYKYYWNTTNNLDSVRFQSYKTAYDYFENTSLLKNMVNIDGQQISYVYDKLNRLKTITSRNGNIIKSYKYNFPSTNDNISWVREKLKFTLSNGSNLDSVVNKTFYDGLGRDLQTINVKASPSFKDVAMSSTKYDSLGYINKIYQPIESLGSNENLVPLNDEFSEFSYETSPVRRISSVTPPDWSPTSTLFYSNTSQISNPEGLIYPAHSLFIESKTDPDGKIIKKYTDKIGREVLKINKDLINEVFTWTIFDDKNRPLRMYPPGSSVSTPNLIFEFFYDESDNLIYKKVPDSDSEEYRYNNRNLQTSLRNPILLTQGKWLITHFDDYGRPIKRGYHIGNDPGNGDQPVIHTMLDEYFYDGFNGTTTNNSPIYKGKLKKAKVKMLDNNGVNSTWVETENFFDVYGRVSTQTITNHLGGNESFMFVYDFGDNILTKIHNISGVNGVNQVAKYTYDHIGRKVYSRTNLNNTGEKTLSECHYNYKNLLTEKNLGRFATSGSHQYLQSLDYMYNAQGWLTAINSLFDGELPCCFDPCEGGGGQFNMLEENIIETDQADLFGMQINYNTALANSGIPASQNGNISSILWRYPGEYNQTYSYRYDFLNRLTESRHGQTEQGSHNLKNHYNEKFFYDPRGNIVQLERKGMIRQNHINPNCFQPATIDSMLYIYIPETNKYEQIIDNVPCHDIITLPAVIDRDAHFAANQIIYVDNTKVNCLTDVRLTSGVDIIITDSLNLLMDCSIPAYVHAHLGPCPDDKFSEGFNQQSATGQYNYDSAGNLTYDPNKKLTFYYNHLNLPYKITGDQNDEMQIQYSADGTLLQRKYIKNNTDITKTDYLRGKELDNGLLESVYHEDGRAIKTTSGWLYEYWLRDYLGNIRVTFADENNDGLITGQERRSRKDYYSFGMEWSNGWILVDTISPVNKYRYNGKEFLQEMNMDVLDNGARWYDPVVVRFLSVDPIAHERSWVSPYNFVQNNPINRVDPTGALDEWVEQNGQMMYDNRVTNQADATALYGEGAIYRPNGYTYSASNGTSIELGDYGFFMQNGQIKSSPDLAASSLANTNPSLAMSNAQSQIAGVRGNYTASAGIVGFISADAAIPEPTDAAWPKWAAYAVAGGIAAYYIAKMEGEIEGIMRRAGGPQGVQYSLQTTSSGSYPCYNCGSGTMNLGVGNVWRYGETTNPSGRYTPGQLSGWGVRQVNEFYGNQVQIKVMEKTKIYGYFLLNGHLPPGNKIFR